MDSRSFDLAQDKFRGNDNTQYQTLWRTTRIYKDFEYQRL